MQMVNALFLCCLRYDVTLIDVVVRPLRVAVEPDLPPKYRAPGNHLVNEGLWKQRRLIRICAGSRQALQRILRSFRIGSKQVIGVAADVYVRF